MTTHIRMLPAAVTLLSLIGAALAAAENQTPKERPDQLRVLAAPDHWRMRTGDDTGEKETVAFLGVETTTVSPTVSAQLSLPRGTGLTVNHVEPKSPAADALQMHDILLKLDDQILIEVRQLAVLIRNHHEGDEVTISYLRAGQKGSVKVKLAKQEVPKFSEAGGWLQPFGNPGEGPFHKFELVMPGPDGEREHMDRVLSLIGRGAQGSPDGPPGFIPEASRIRIERGNGPGVRAMSMNTRNSNIAYSDDDGMLDLAIKDGVKTLVAKDAKGGEVFSGPVTTPAERAAMPKEVRSRLEKLEGMNNLTFHTDGDFQGTEMKVMRPRGISLPLPARMPAPSRSLFF